MGDALESLKRQLESHRGNLRKLEERAALCGLDVPLKLLNEIEHEKEEIARLKEEIAGLEKRLQDPEAIKELEVRVVARDPLYKNAAELLKEAKLRQEARERVLRERVMKVLRAPAFQATVSVLALLVAVGTWFWPDIRILLFSTIPTVTPTSAMAVNLADARVSFTITPRDGNKLEVPSGGTLTLTPGEAVLIETIIAVGQSSFPRDLTYEYLAPIGSIPGGLVGPRTSYVAPDRPGPDFITVLITDLGTDDGILRSINVAIKEKSP